MPPARRPPRARGSESEAPHSRTTTPSGASQDHPDGFIQNKAVTSVVGGEIEGVLIAELREFPDERGRFIETFRQEWFAGKAHMVQGNRSDSRKGVVRALHFHRRQADYWYCPSG